jgi:hypothetical protein
MVGVVLLSSLSLALAQNTRENQYGINQTQPKEVKYYRLKCKSWRTANGSEACTGCAKTVCTAWEQVQLTPEQVKAQRKAKK